MKPDLFYRIASVSVFVVSIISVLLYLYSGKPAAIGFLIGGLWSTANLWVLFFIVYTAFFQNRLLYVFLLLQIKIPVLYGVGYLILVSITMDFIWGIVGFHVPIAITAFSFLRDRKQLQDSNTIG